MKPTVSHLDGNRLSAWRSALPAAAGELEEPESLQQECVSRSAAALGWGPALPSARRLPCS